MLALPQRIHRAIGRHSSWREAMPRHVCRSALIPGSRTGLLETAMNSASFSGGTELGSRARNRWSGLGRGRERAFPAWVEVLYGSHSRSSSGYISAFSSNSG